MVNGIFLTCKAGRDYSAEQNQHGISSPLSWTSLSLELVAVLTISTNKTHNKKPGKMLEPIFNLYGIHSDVIYKQINSIKVKFSK